MCKLVCLCRCVCVWSSGCKGVGFVCVGGGEVHASGAM